MLKAARQVLRADAVGSALAVRVVRRTLLLVAP